MTNRNKGIFQLFFAGMDLFALNAVHLALIMVMNRIDRSGQQYNAFFIVSNMAWLASAYINAVYTRTNSFNFDNFGKLHFIRFSIPLSPILLQDNSKVIRDLNLHFDK